MCRGGDHQQTAAPCCAVMLHLGRTGSTPRRVDSAGASIIIFDCGTIRAAGAVWPSATSRVFADSLSTGVFISFVEHRLVIQGFFSQVGDSTPPFLCRRLGLTLYPLCRFSFFAAFPSYRPRSPRLPVFRHHPPVRSWRESSRVPFPSLHPTGLEDPCIDWELMLGGWVSGECSQGELPVCV